MTTKRTRRIHHGQKQITHMDQLTLGQLIKCVSCTNPENPLIGVVSKKSISGDRVYISYFGDGILINNNIHVYESDNEIYLENIYELKVKNSLTKQSQSDKSIVGGENDENKKAL